MLVQLCLFMLLTFYNKLFDKEVISVDYLATKVIALMLISIEVKSMDESFEKVKGYSFIGKIVKLIIQAKDVKKKLAE